LASSERLRTSLLRTVLFLISRLSIEPVATAYEVPPSATKNASVDITFAYLGVCIRPRESNPRVSLDAAAGAPDPAN
jgi:uncharacterized membrane protein